MRNTQPVETLLGRLCQEPGRPRVTWYDGDERVELSGHVLDNWVSKTTNLLVEEFDLGPGRTAHVDLPGHWRALVWWLAVLRSGACLDLSGDAGADVVVTHEPSRFPTAADLVVVSLPALARRAEVELPPGAVDAAAAVMTYGDALGPVLPAQPAETAVRLPEENGTATPVTYADLLDWAGSSPALEALVLATGESPDDVPARTPAPAAPRRVLIDAGGDPGAVLAACLAVLAGNGSVVLCSAGDAAALRTDPARRARLRAGERLTD